MSVFVLHTFTGGREPLLHVQVCYAKPLSCVVEFTLPLFHYDPGRKGNEWEAFDIICTCIINLCDIAFHVVHVTYVVCTVGYAMGAGGIVSFGNKNSVLNIHKCTSVALWENIGSAVPVISQSYRSAAEHPPIHNWFSK